MFHAEWKMGAVSFSGYTAPMSQSELLVFSSSMEGMWRALQPPTPLEAAAFTRAGITGKNFQAAYPLIQYTDLLDACGESRFSHLAPLERFAEVGRLFMKGYEKTLIGNALLAVLRVLGPKRTLERMTRNFRTANNYTEVTVEPLAPNHHRVRITHVTRPGLFVGLLEVGCTYAGAKDLSVTLLEHAGQVAQYEVKWA
jgi:uncharacterized protein (TIGR02265 family)